MRDKMDAITIAFHDVVEEGSLASPIAPGYTTLYTLERRAFRNHLESIRSCLGSRTVRRISRAPALIPDSVFLTFDDGTISAYSSVAPELERLGWPGHFFITTDWIGRPGFVDQRQIGELHRRGHVIGSHSRSHPPRMSQLSWSEAFFEWSESSKMLSDVIGEQIRVASVPNGYFSRTVVDAARGAGIEVLFTSEPCARAYWIDDCMILGRYSIRRNTPPSVSGAIVAGARWPRFEQEARWLATKSAERLIGPYYGPIRRLLVH